VIGFQKCYNFIAITVKITVERLARLLEMLSLTTFCGGTNEGVKQDVRDRNEAIYGFSFTDR